MADARLKTPTIWRPLPAPEAEDTSRFAVSPTALLLLVNFRCSAIGLPMVSWRVSLGEYVPEWRNGRRAGLKIP